MSMNGKTEPPQALAMGAIVALVGTLCSTYVISQLLRNSIGVIAPDLAAELDFSASQIGILSSLFFFSFAAAQLPLGIALDRYGPKRCMLACAVVVIAGALLFASAATSTGLIAARILMGLGTSCYLMAPLAFYARHFAANRFATFAGLQLGIGTGGTLLATAPLAFSASIIGWRATFAAIAAVMGIAALLIAVVVRDESSGAAGKAGRESLWQGLRGIREVWATDSVGRLFLMNITNYSSFVLVVGLWGGPYLSHVYGYSLTERGNLLLVAAITQMIGMVSWGTADRVFGNYKVPALLGAGTTCVMLLALAVFGRLPLPVLILWFAVFGFCSAFTPVVIAHGKSLFPPHLVGRGITLLNMGSLGGVFISQTLTGIVIDIFPTEAGAYPLASYRLVFALQAAFLLVTSAVYLRARDPLGQKGLRAPSSRDGDN